MTTQTTETLEVMKELLAAGVTPGEEMERQIQDPGGEVVHAGDEETPTPMVGTSSTGAGYTTVYHTETGLDSQVSNNMLPMQLKKKLPSGKRAFTIYDPGFRPTEGTLTCYMHPDNPMRSVCDEFGFPVCEKKNISSPFQLRIHMAKRHGQEWMTLEQRRLDIKEQEQVDIQRATLEAIQGNGHPAMQPPVADLRTTVAEPVVEANDLPVGDSTPTVALDPTQCPHCVWRSGAKKKSSQRSSVANHIRQAHPKT